MRSRNWSATRPATLTGKCSAGCATLGGSQRYSRPRVKSLRAGLQESHVWSGLEQRERIPSDRSREAPGLLGRLSEPGRYRSGSRAPTRERPHDHASARLADRRRLETSDHQVSLETSSSSGARRGRAAARGRARGAARARPRARPAGTPAPARSAAARASPGPTQASCCSRPRTCARRARDEWPSRPPAQDAQVHVHRRPRAPAARARRPLAGAASRQSLPSRSRCRFGRRARRAGLRWASSETCPAFFGCPYSSRPAATAPSDSSTRNGEYTAVVPSGSSTGIWKADSQ